MRILREYPKRLRGFQGRFVFPGVSRGFNDVSGSFKGLRVRFRVAFWGFQVTFKEVSEAF